MATMTSDMAQKSTSVVVVPNGSPLTCLRMDMAIELVSEVWVMVSHGLLHHQPHEGEGGRRPRGSKMKPSTKPSKVTPAAAQPPGMI